jgi:hypothetical protein
MRVYARKRIDVMPDVRSVKLLIQSAFTSANQDCRPGLQAASQLGVTCRCLLPLRSSASLGTLA